MDIYLILQQKHYADGYEQVVPLYAKYSVEEAEKEVDYLSNYMNEYEPEWDKETEYDYGYMVIKLTQYQRIQPTSCLYRSSMQNLLAKCVNI